MPVMTAKSDPYFLSAGRHDSPDQGRCAMEWVAHLAGEPHSDKPRCVSPLLCLFCIELNDLLPSEKRQKLRPYLARTIGTAGDGRNVERGQICRDYLFETVFPRLLAHDELALEELRVLTASNLLTASKLSGVHRLPELQKAMYDIARRARNRSAGHLSNSPDPKAAWAADIAVKINFGFTVTVTGIWATRPYLDRLDAIATFWQIEELHKEFINEAFVLLDRMLPTEPLELPVARDADLVCGTA